MNRYQRDAAEMDRRHALLVRAMTFLGSACLILAALWSAGFPPSSWWQSAQRSWSAFDEPGVAESVPARPRVVETVSRSDVSAAGAANALTGTDSSVSPTPQQLLLVSTAPGRNEHEGTARIGTSPENPQTYVAGAILVNGSRLAEIHSDHVVLERGKETVALFLRSAAGAANNGQAQGSVDLAVVPAMSGKPAQVEPLGADSLGEVIRSMAYYENDLLQGLQVFPGRQAGTFARLGLKPADVIVSVDSVAVTDAQSALEYLHSLTQGAAIAVRVRRDAAFHTLSLDGTLIEAASTKTSRLAQPAPPDMERTFQ